MQQKEHEQDRVKDIINLSGKKPDAQTIQGDNKDCAQNDAIHEAKLRKIYFARLNDHR